MNEVVPIDSIKEMGPMGIMLLAGIVSWCFLGWLVPSLRRGYLDQPNARSSHKVPTPRGGGIAFVVVSCLLSPLVMGGTAAWIPLLCMPLSIVGLIDDRVDLPAGVRYAAQLATALALLLISPLPHPAWSYPILLVSITAVINFTNFMDGLDGLVGLCCFVIMAAVGMWTIAGALLGFLLWNWSPAKVFMGDVGSTWLGAVIAGIALQKATVSEAFAVLLLGSPLLGDALICVLLRLRAGQPVFEAHRLHLFQRLQRSGWPHAKVSTVYGLATAAITMALLTKGVIAEVLAVAATMLAALILNKRCAVPFAASRTQTETMPEPRMTRISQSPREITGRVMSFINPVVARRSLLLLFDGILIVSAFYGAFALRLHEKESLFQSIDSARRLPWLAIATGLPILFFSGWYKGLTRYAGSYSLYSLLPRTIIMVLALLSANTLLGYGQPPRSFWILYWILFSGGAIASRIVLRDLLMIQLDRHERKQLGDTISDGTLIYGAGYSGLNLLNALRSDSRFRIIGFLDDDTQFHGRTLHNIKIFSPEILPSLVQQQKVTKVLLAMPSISRERKRLLVDQLTHLGLQVLSIPSLSQLANGQNIVSDIRSVRIEDLLGREPSQPDPELLSASVFNKVVLVTGGGGSIGSELCRQVVALQARVLLILDQNEFSLYSIEKELRRSRCTSEIIPLLGDCSESSRLLSICSRYKVQTIFHAAAYKHVPLVEANPCAGVANNLKSTCSVVHAASSPSVERVTLISTDKAVRPTNMMGATKRICELVFQHASKSNTGNKPVFSMVRFGNVLGSSGSVIPLFHEQIAMGGPITVTHPSITRYFMTIPEAVQLVLQASGMALGGELFLLDMGEPVRIADLARQMIELSGLRIKDINNPTGDIAIEYTGLRPGEKLYEELLINHNDEETQHPLIRKAKEPSDSTEDFNRLVEELIKNAEDFDTQRTIELVQKLVPEYKPNGESVATSKKATIQVSR